ncbi:MAG UNVERIFIED_CONTAM: hypothetical protein LVT10_25030 [Anaerolineae bacterium]
MSLAGCATQAITYSDLPTGECGTPGRNALSNKSTVPPAVAVVTLWKAQRGGCPFVGWGGKCGTVPPRGLHF